MAKTATEKGKMNGETMEHNDKAHERTSSEADAIVIAAANQKPPLRFRGKVAFWWYAMLALMLGCTLAFIVQSVLGIATSSPNVTIHIVIAVMFAFFDVFIVDSCIRNYVELREDSLKVRFSVLTETIPYSKISLIRETNNAWASLSASLDRLQVQYRRYQYILIAVKDKEGFLLEMQARIPATASIERKARTKNPTDTA